MDCEKIIVFEYCKTVSTQITEGILQFLELAMILSPKRQ